MLPSRQFFGLTTKFITQQSFLNHSPFMREGQSKILISKRRLALSAAQQKRKVRVRLPAIFLIKCKQDENFRLQPQKPKASRESSDKWKTFAALHNENIMAKKQHLINIIWGTHRCLCHSTSNDSLKMKLSWFNKV